MTFRNLSFAQKVLLALGVLLAAAYLYMLSAPIPTFDVPKLAPVATGKTGASPPPAFVPPMEQAFAEIDARPLFSPLRRPQKLPPVVGQIAAPPPVNLSLVGIIMGPDARIAVMKAPGSPAAINAGIGRTIGGWKVEQIEADRVILTAGGTKQEIKLRSQTGN